MKRISGWGEKATLAPVGLSSYRIINTTKTTSVETLEAEMGQAAV